MKNKYLLYSGILYFLAAAGVWLGLNFVKGGNGCVGNSIALFPSALLSILFVIPATLSVVRWNTDRKEDKQWRFLFYNLSVSIFMMCNIAFTLSL